MIECQIEVFLNIFTIEEEKIKILLLKKDNSQYGTLPSRLLKIDESLEASALKICNKFKITNPNLIECHTFSEVDRNKIKRTIAVSYMVFLNRNDIQNYDFLYELYDINNLPPMAFDHGDIISNAITCFKREMLNLENFKKIFPDKFTFPSLQKIFEEIINEKMDRRNFRKKFLPFVLELEEKSNVTTGGRPAKLYSFKEINLERNLFNAIK